MLLSNYSGVVSNICICLQLQIKSSKRQRMSFSYTTPLFSDTEAPKKPLQEERRNDGRKERKKDGKESGKEGGKAVQPACVHLTAEILHHCSLVGINSISKTKFKVNTLD